MFCSFFSNNRNNPMWSPDDSRDLIWRVGNLNGHLGVAIHAGTHQLLGNKLLGLVHGKAVNLDGANQWQLNCAILGYAYCRSVVQTLEDMHCNEISAPQVGIPVRRKKNRWIRRYYYGRVDRRGHSERWPAELSAGCKTA